MAQAKKIIDKTIVWTCENLDLNAQINWQGYSILFNDNTSVIVEKNENLNCYEIASKQERKDFARSLGYIFEGDMVEIIKGRKIPLGERKIVKYGYRYQIRGTYGHCYVDYLVFTDGTKTAIDNIKQVNVELFENAVFRFVKDIPIFQYGGRL